MKQRDVSDKSKSIAGAKLLFQRSGIVQRGITMLSAMGSLWATSDTVRRLFVGSFILFVAVAGIVMIGWMFFDYWFLLPNEMGFRQSQAHGSADRSPLKKDTELIMDKLDQLQDTDESD